MLYVFRVHLEQQVLFDWIWGSISFLLSHRVVSYALASLALAAAVAVVVAGPHSEIVLTARHNVWFVVWSVLLLVFFSAST